MPWEKTYQDADVLESAMRAFWARGYEATSMADLVKATGINRGSIYSAFDDKRGLFLRALQHYDMKHRADFLSDIARDHDPKEAILATFRKAAEGHADTPSGCLLVNTALEMSPHDPEIAAFVGERLGEVETFFCECITQAQSAGSVSADKDARATAQALLGLFLGLRVLSRATPGQSAIPTLIQQAEHMLS